MSAVINITLNSFAVTITLILIISLRYVIYQRNKLTNFFFVLLFTNLILLCSSILLNVYGIYSNVNARFFIVILNFLLYFCWYVIKTYSSMYLFTFISLKVKVSRKFPLVFFGIGIFSVVLLVISQFTGLFFTICENNIVHRSNLFWLAYTGPLLLYFVDIVMLCIHLKKLDVKDTRVLLIFELLPMITFVILIFNNNILFINTAFTLSFLILYLKVQSMLTGELVTLRQKAEEQNLIIMNGIAYANRIQRNILPPAHMMTDAFSDYSVIWEPRDVVGGDIYYMKQFDKGTVLCVCDCTGHGTSGALLTMLVVSALEAVVWPSNSDDPAGAIYKIDEKLAKVFSIKKMGSRDTDDLGIRDGCDIAIMFIAKDGSVILSSGHMNVFICDGKQVRRIKGQNIFVGEGRLTSKDEIKTIHIAANPENKFYIASDGLFDQPGNGLSNKSSICIPRTLPFGYKAFEKIILENHHEKQSIVSDRVWDEFEKHRGKEPRVDDFELISFVPKIG